MVRFPPPKIARYVFPPLCEFPIYNAPAKKVSKTKYLSLMLLYLQLLSLVLLLLGLTQHALLQHFYSCIPFQWAYWREWHFTTKSWTQEPLTACFPCGGSTVRVKIITGRLVTLENLPFATKTLPTRKKIFSNYFPITVSRLRLLRIKFRKLPDTYCICVSCVTLPGWDPCPCRNIYYYRYPIWIFPN